MVDASLALDNDKFQRLQRSLKKYLTVQMFSGVGSSDESVWGKGFGDVDEFLEVVFAWVWHGCSPPWCRPPAP